MDVGQSGDSWGLYWLPVEWVWELEVVTVDTVDFIISSTIGFLECVTVRFVLAALANGGGGVDQERQVDEAYDGMVTYTHHHNQGAAKEENRGRGIGEGHEHHG